MTKKLTPKQERFVAEYMVDLNATQAAIRAGYSAKTAPQQASRLLSNVNVSAAVAKCGEDIIHRLEISRDHIASELASMGFATPDGVVFKYSDKRQSLMDLAKLEGFLVNRTELTGADGGPIAVAEEKRLDVNDPDDRATIRRIVTGWTRVLQRYDEENGE